MAFCLRWPHFCDLTCLRMHLPMIRQGQKYRLPLKRILPVQILPIYAELGYYWWLWRSFASVTLRKVIRGHIMTSRDKYAFLPTSFDRIEIETWGRHQWVCYGHAHHMICNIVYLDHFMTFTWGKVQPNSIVDHTMLKTYYSIHLDEANTMVLVYASYFKPIKRTSR